MDKIRQVLDKYPNDFKEITVTSHLVILPVKDLDRAVTLLEKHDIYVKEVSDNGAIQMSFFIVAHSAHNPLYPKSGFIQIPHTSSLSFFRNILN